MVDFKKTNLFSGLSALKVTDIKTGTINTPATSSSVSVTATIPHGFPDDKILVNCVSTFPTAIGTFLSTTPVGYSTRTLFVTWDSTNIYVTATSAADQNPAPALAFNYTLSVLIP